MFNFFRTLNLGAKYMEIWPQNKIIGSIFPENRVKHFMTIAKYVIPPFFVFSILWTYYIYGGFSYPGIGIFYALKQNIVFLSATLIVLILLPVQGYYWFGKRAMLSLNDKQRQFYNDLREKLGKEQEAAPTMFDLGKTLKEALEKLDKDFLNSL